MRYVRDLRRLPINVDSLSYSSYKTMSKYCAIYLYADFVWWNYVGYPHKTRGWVSGFLRSSASDRRDNASEPRNNHPLALIVNMNCQRCKRRKIRCDKARPKCGTCTRLDAVCEYGTLILRYRLIQPDTGPQKRGYKDDQIAELIKVISP